MTNKNKSYIQVASNSLTLDDISELVEQARKEAEEQQAQTVALEPPPREQIVSATEIYSQPQADTESTINNDLETIRLQTAPPTEETVPQIEQIVEPTQQTVVQTCTVPLVTASAGKPNSTINYPAPLSFEAALKQAENRVQNEPQPDQTIAPRSFQQPVQQVPFIKPRASQIEQTAPVLPKADIQEHPSDWLPDIGTDKGRADVESTLFQNNSQPSRQLSEAEQQNISEFAQNVLESFPSGLSSVLLVADVDGDTRGNQVASNLARELAGKNIGKILLVDSHLEERALTQELAPKSELGFADVISMDRHLGEAIFDSGEPNLDFLPAGTAIMCRRRDQQQKKLAEIVQDVKTRYQFVVVATGSAFGHGANVWARNSEATYVTVSMSQSNQTIAKTGVQVLQKHGARVMGCVITDAAA